MTSEHHQHALSELSHLIRSGVISQTDVSRATGVHQSQVSRILAGHSRRRSPNLLKLCAYAESMHRDGDVASEVPEALARELTSFMGVKPGEEKLFGAVLIALRRWRAEWRQDS